MMISTSIPETSTGTVDSLTAESTKTWMRASTKSTTPTTTTITESTKPTAHKGDKAPENI